MKKQIILSSLAAASGLASVGAQAQDIMARVISSTPVVQQVAVPRQYCNNAQVLTQGPNSGAGAVMGAVAGGALGNAVGNGGGRAIATVIGLVGGAMVGNNIEGANTQVQNVQQCNTQTSYENRTAYYNVVYEYADRRYNVQMQNDPGLYVRLQATPAGAVPQGQVQAQANPQIYQQPQYQQYQQYQQYPQNQQYQQYQTAPAPVYVQPGYVQSGYVQQTYVQQAPVVVYSQPYYYQRPYYAPIGLSLNFGYSRGFGHHHGHWR